MTRTFSDRIDQVDGVELVGVLAEQLAQHVEGVVDLRGRTSLRQLVRLMYHAQGAISAVSLLMHLAAAVEVKPGMPKNRPCVVIAGGREPAHWEAYTHHQYISNNGALPCCKNGGCWKSRCQPVGDAGGAIGEWDIRAARHALTSVMLDAARQEPLIVAIDNLCQAEPVVLEFLAFLSRSVRQASVPRECARTTGPSEPLPRLLVVATYRTHTGKEDALHFPPGVFGSETAVAPKTGAAARAASGGAPQRVRPPVLPRDLSLRKAPRVWCACGFCVSSLASASTWGS